jgi:hypothetical protein
MGLVLRDHTNHFCHVGTIYQRYKVCNDLARSLAVKIERSGTRETILETHLCGISPP